MKRHLITLYFLLSILSFSKNLYYNEEEIDYCVQRGTGDDADTCAKRCFDADSCKEGFYNIGGIYWPCSTNSPFCAKCHHEVSISGGICTACSDDLNDFSKGECYCFPGFAKSSHSTCQYCGNNFVHCNINQKTRRPEWYLC